jgi:hypothetical protein
MKEDAHLEQASDDVQTVFDYWRYRIVHLKARLDEKRRRKIRMRLNDGYTVQQLRDAIDGCATSKFHMGQNDRRTAYNDIELICRDASHVDKFTAMLNADREIRRASAVKLLWLR